jgi:hypothetical protein
MEQAAGQHSTAVFAADGPVRHRVVRATVVTGVALLVAWLIALGLGVLGGFDSLPALPGVPSQGPNEASSQTPAPPPTAPRSASRPASKARPADTGRASTSPTSPSPVSTGSQPTSTPKKQPTSVSPSPSTSTSAPSAGATHGRALGTTKTITTGKPLGSPGNGPGGSGAPGQFR